MKPEDAISDFAIPIALLLWTCSWIPLWKITDLQAHFFGTKRRWVFLPLVSLLCLLPGAAALPFTLSAIKTHFPVGSDDERVLVILALVALLLHTLIFSVWQVPYCVGKRVDLTMLLLGLSLVCAVVTAILLSIANISAVATTLFFCWTSLLGCHFFINAVVVALLSDWPTKSGLSVMEICYALGLFPQK
jgi:hypothetical protein